MKAENIKFDFKDDIVTGCSASRIAKQYPANYITQVSYNGWDKKEEAIELGYF